MAYPSDRRLDLNVGEDVDMSSPNNIWRPSFLSATSPFTVRDSMIKNDITATVIARNLLTPKDNMILYKRSDELAVQDSLAFSVQCAGSVSNMVQRLLARTRQVESLMAEVASLKQEIRGLKHENKELHMLANSYSTSMKRKLDQLQESEGRIQSDHRTFVALLQRHLLPSSSRALPSVEAPNSQPSAPLLLGAPPSGEASNSQPPAPFLPGAPPSTKASSTEASHK
ncbi:hypothetical protein ACFX2A_025864 [Malus domestica]